jgi:CrcB protein
MVRLILLAIGGALGTLARYGLNGVVSARATSAAGSLVVFPFGTLFVNITGCFAVGFIAALSDSELGRVWLPPEWRDLLMVGFCGGFTTFSSYALQTLNLSRDGEWLFVAANIVGSNVLCLAAVYLGRVCGLVLQSRWHGSGA